MDLYPNGDPVEEARLLLPWYITGKLTEAERALVERMLEQHTDLKEEYLRELMLVDMIRANESLLRLTAVDTTQQRLDKLLKQIGREERALGQTSREPAMPAARKPVTDWWQFFRNLFPEDGWLKPANAVFALLLLVQAGFLGWFAHALSTSEDSIYVTAGVADNKAEVPVIRGMVLLMGFNGNAPMSQVQDFLLKWDARILDGPDANNLFKVEFRAIDPDDLLSGLTLQQIQQDQAVVDFAGRPFQP
ncbi:hypothetical protein [Thiothrix nivea]|uniref:Uncharacterized protein n=1 Tax=Thiothrix nivea (strain ATCC 35100 / DSM 5205 / JP2) TaxID=870187 RepID=A0A656HJ00_THINJ|nr:hypothetical protein [Thiothrix nivea]EIJ35209.1 hypothetical protein Thini_2671 [Thiothrix nivea DSM 5205]